jgi:hypothetical protein
MLTGLDTLCDVWRNLGKSIVANIAAAPKPPQACQSQTACAGGLRLACRE